MTSVDALYRRQVEDLWSEYHRGLLPPRQVGEIRFNPPLAMSGPDARNFCNYAGLSDDFVRFMKLNGIPVQ